MTNTHDLLVQELFTLFSEKLNVIVQDADTDLFETGILDSQRLVELLLHIEQEFGAPIVVEDFEAANFSCIDRIATLILERDSADTASKVVASKSA